VFSIVYHRRGWWSCWGFGQYSRPGRVQKEERTSSQRTIHIDEDSRQQSTTSRESLSRCVSPAVASRGSLQLFKQIASGVWYVRARGTRSLRSYRGLKAYNAGWPIGEASECRSALARLWECNSVAREGGERWIVAFAAVLSLGLFWLPGHGTRGHLDVWG
jgi:hypothetical protein